MTNTQRHRPANERAHSDVAGSLPATTDEGGRSTGAPTVEFSHVDFAYEAGHPVLQDASFRISGNEMYSVIGPNGGGKTTVAKLILGLLSPTAGTVRVLGHRPKATRSAVGYVPQYTQFDPRFPATVLDVVLMGALHPHTRFYRAADRARARDVLGEVDLEGLDRRSFADLSGGQRQRVLIARALMTNPQLFLLDEPTANVDAAAERRLTQLLARLSQRMTVMLITHDLGFVAEHVHHVVCVRTGVHVHPTAEVTPDMITHLYGASVRAVRHDVDVHGDKPAPQEGMGDHG